MRSMRGITAARGLLLLLTALLVLPATPAAAEDGERITLLAVDLTVRADGTLAVTETIDYDFAGSTSKHGLLAYLPLRAVWAPDSDYYREWPVSDLQVTADGAPAPHTQSLEGDYLVSRVGEEDTTVTGRHRYVLRYTVRGAFDTFGAPDPHDELYWNAVGAGWNVPIDSATVRLTTPVPVREAACFAGPTGSTAPCATAAGDGTAFAATGLGDHQAVTVVVGLPKGSIAGAGPILTERHDVAYRLGLRRGTWPITATAGLAALLAALAGLLLYRRGRDRRYAGQIPGLTPAAGQPVGEEYRPVGTSPEGPVEFVPPKGARPGGIGALITERAGVRDVTATVVDLAVRGYLTVEDVGKGDWRLSKRREAGEELRPYEVALLAALFEDRSEVLLSDLRNTFAKANNAAVDGIYDDLVAQGWYRARPDRTRRSAALLGGLLLLAALVLGIVLAFTVHLGLLAAAVAVAGLVLLACARVAPARTPDGSAAYARALGFRRYIRVAEADQIRAEERAGVFSRYLPYAVAFGETKRWVATFAAVGAADVAAVGWFGSPLAFGTSVSDFGSAAGTAFTSVPASGGSGFSGSAGGGGGGGGGGSW
jgi:uncharacterized membrane protein YgcG